MAWTAVCLWAFSFFMPVAKGDFGWAVAFIALLAIFAKGPAHFYGLIVLVNLLVPFAPVVMKHGKTRGALIFTLLFLAGAIAPAAIFFPYDGLQMGFWAWEASLVMLSVGLAKRTWW